MGNEDSSGPEAAGHQIMLLSEFSEYYAKYLMVVCFWGAWQRVGEAQLAVGHGCATPFERPCRGRP